MRYRMQLLRFKGVFLFLSLYLSTLAAESPQEGLRFHSFEVDKDKRTSLNLTPDKPLKFSDEFSMEFDFKLSARGENFGYIFRIIGNDSLNIDFLSDVRTSQNFLLIIGSKTVIQFKINEIPDFNFEQWMTMKVICHLKKNKLAFSFNGIEKTVDYPFTGLNNFRIYFGGNFDDAFSTNDIPPMVIKNIRIHNEKGALVRNWELHKHLNNYVYDSCKNEKAVAVNPVWEIDRHVIWQKRKTFYIPEIYPKIAYDKRFNRFFIAGKKQLIIYDMLTQTSDSVSYLSGVPFNENCNQLAYDEKNSRLISYNFFNNELNYFDFETKTWTNNSNSFVEPRFWHNSKYYFSDDSLLVAFGGYGYHKYSALLQKYRVKEKTWEKYDISSDISPRYLTATGLMKDSILLLFGGYGNTTGDQYESPHNYYDLYAINVYTNQVSKLWSASFVKDNYANANSLIYNEKNNLFYTLSYSNKKYESVLFLHEYTLTEPGFKVLGDSIPYIFSDVESYCNLYSSGDESELIAVTSLTKNYKTEINIYSIAFPPFSKTDVLQVEKTKQVNLKPIIAFLVLLILAVLFFVLKKITKKRQSGLLQEVLPGLIISKLPKHSEEKIIAPSINLLGEFKILDSCGNNLSNNFTSTAKQIFLMILFTTVKNKQGITSEVIRNLFWPDKDDHSARNNRNVYINRLRALLENVGNLKIFKQGNYWTITDLKEVFCDYERIVSLVAQFNDSQKFDLSILDEILDIAQKGKLLPHYEVEWLDEYKTEYSNLIIEFLVEIGKLPELHDNLPLQLRTLDILLIHDSIDEDSVRLKCKALFNLGKKRQALECYKKFSEEYKTLLGVETNIRFEDMLK